MKTSRTSDSTKGPLGKQAGDKGLADHLAKEGKQSKLGRGHGQHYSGGPGGSDTGTAGIGGGAAR